MLRISVQVRTCIAGALRKTRIADEAPVAKSIRADGRGVGRDCWAGSVAAAAILGIVVQIDAGVSADGEWRRTATCTLRTGSARIAARAAVVGVIPKINANAPIRASYREAALRQLEVRRATSSVFTHTLCQGKLQNSWPDALICLIYAFIKRGIVAGYGLRHKIPKATAI